MAIADFHLIDASDNGRRIVLLGWQVAAAQAISGGMFEAHARASVLVNMPLGAVNAPDGRPIIIENLSPKDKQDVLEIVAPQIGGRVITNAFGETILVRDKVVLVEVNAMQLEEMLLEENILQKLARSPQFRIEWNMPIPMPRLRPTLGVAKWIPEESLGVVVVERFGDMADMQRADGRAMGAYAFNPPTGPVRAYINQQDVRGARPARRNPFVGADLDIAVDLLSIGVNGY